MDTVLSAMIGVGLAAACGFRVFVPMLVVSLAARVGEFQLSEGFSWLASYPAMIAFAIATLLEIAGYYIPWVDNLLDAVASPTAVIAGVVLAASAMGEANPFLRWTLAILAGGGAAGVVQGLTATVRQLSTFTTGGLGNPLVATAEAGGSALLSVLAITVPVVAVLAVVLLLVFGVRKLLFRRPPARAA